MTLSWMGGGSGWWRKAGGGEGTKAGVGPGEEGTGREAIPGAGREPRGTDPEASRGAGLPRRRKETDPDLTMRKVGPDRMIEKVKDLEVVQMRGKKGLEADHDQMKGKKGLVANQMKEMIDPVVGQVPGSEK